MTEFIGSWSYSSEEMIELFKNIDTNVFRENYNIIEFGCGDSSIKLFKIFDKVKNLLYYALESDINYVPNFEKIKAILYDETKIDSFVLKFEEENLLFDLVLVDGPTGEKRKLWYYKFKKYVKIGTIILIDDFNHFESFGEELDKHYEYEVLSFNNDPPIPGKGKSWKIVKVNKIK